MRDLLDTKIKIIYCFKNFHNVIMKVFFVDIFVGTISYLLRTKKERN